LRLIPGFSEDWIKLPFYDIEKYSQVVSIIGFLGLVAYIWLGANRKPASA